MRRGTVRRPGKKGAGGTLKKQMIVMAAMLAILAFEAVYLAYQSSNRLASSVSDVWQGMLETQSEHVRNSLFMNNPYLTPDTLYLAKLKAAFYDDPDMVVETGREAGCDPGLVSLAISNLCSNIKMGITYSTSLRSCYWMLEDPDAPYVLINGNPTIKAEVTDAEWMDVCREMEQDVKVEWRTIPLSYLNNTLVLTVYRRIRSESFLPGETITGYWVLNYDLSNMLSAFTAQMSGAGFVCLYDTRREDGLTAGNFELPQQEETEIVEKVLQAWETDSPTGVVRNGQNEAFYYRAEEVCPGTLSIVCIQDRQLSQALDGVVRSITAALLVSCVAVAGINLYSILRYRKYSRGLRKMFDALRSRQGEQRAAEDPQESTGSEILLQRILNNDVDLEELQGLVESKRELKAELDALYGHVQINSHFLLNTLDSIYWSSVSRMGADSKESAMIGDLCEILKYALDSSDLYTSLREEVECTLRYIEIQQMRKNIVFNVEWDIPDELYNARVCKLILQPVIENCVQHAFQITKERAFRIRIAARKTEEGYLCISVEDNGYGISPKRIRQMNLEMKKQRYLRIRHIGLANVNRRLQVQFGGRSGVSLSAIEGGGLRVCLTMKYGVYEPDAALNKA